MIQYINNVPTGDSVLMYSIGNAQYSVWPAAAKAKLGELGVSVAQLNALQDGEPVDYLWSERNRPARQNFTRQPGSPKSYQLLDERPFSNRWIHSWQYEFRTYWPSYKMGIN